MTLYFAHSVIGRLVRRLLQETKSPKSPANTLVFESLEPRLLLAADPLGITVIEANGSTQLHRGWGPFFPLRRQRIRPLAEIWRRGCMWRVSLAPGRRSARSRRQPGMRLPGRSRAPISTRFGTPTAAATTSQISSALCRERALRWNRSSPAFHQDLNGDGLIGRSTTVIEANGSTSLTEVGDHFFLYDGSGSGPSLKYAGADVCGGSVWRLDADRRGADGKRV